jgi:hypothetical protein
MSAGAVKGWIEMGLVLKLNFAKKIKLKGNQQKEKKRVEASR